jgi:hypothetical protein
MPRPNSRAQASEALSPVANPEDFLPGIVPDNAAATAFLGYQEQRDELLEFPFTHNTTMAENGVVFTIEKALGVRYGDDINDPTKTVEQFAYLIRLQTGYVWENRNGTEAQDFDKGTLMLLCLTKNGIRAADMEQIKNILVQVGPIPNCALQQYPNKDSAKNPSVGIVHASKWMPLRELVQRRMGR